MNPNIERHSNPVVNVVATRGHKCSARADQERSDRELVLRLEERRKERERIARELHDTLFQGFLGASMQVQDAMEQLPESSPTKAVLDRAARLMRRVIDEGRDALCGLRTSRTASVTLEESLTHLRDELTPDNGPRLRIFAKGEPKELKPAIQEQVFMIGREALMNALRHSEATSIEAEVTYFPRRLCFVVRDNGRGIHPEVVGAGRQGHWGLLGMRERAESIGAKLRIWSKPGAGTEVEISVPDDAVVHACA